MPEPLELERLVDDPEIRRAAAKILKGFCLTYLPHHVPADLSEFFDKMAGALEVMTRGSLERSSASAAVQRTRR
jgi:hypothetical protein